MASAAALLAEYADDHRNPVNKLLHRVCVPVIVLSLFGLLWSIPLPAGARALPAGVNWATLAMVPVLAWYLVLSPRLALGMALAFGGVCAVIAWLESLATPLWLTCTILFVLAWIGQFIGHGFEGRRPSFLRDLRFLLVGPLWLVAGLYQRLGLRA